MHTDINAHEYIGSYRYISAHTCTLRKQTHLYTERNTCRCTYLYTDGHVHTHAHR